MGRAVQIRNGLRQLRLDHAAICRREILAPAFGREAFAVPAAAIAPSAASPAPPAPPLGFAVGLARHFGPGRAVAGLLGLVRAGVVILARRREFCGRLMDTIAPLGCPAIAALARPAAAAPAPPLALLALVLA